MATLSHAESRRLYSWWWDSHISPKNSKWLQENLTDMDTKVKAMIKLIEEDADSFARRAEMYYKKRPELMKLVEEFYRAYRALAERYDHATGALRQAHRTIAEAFPNQVPLALNDDSPSGSSMAESEPHTPEIPHSIRALFDPDDLQKDTLGVPLHFQATKRNGAHIEDVDGVTGKKGLKQLNGIFSSGNGTDSANFAEGRVRKGLKFQEQGKKGSECTLQDVSRDIQKYNKEETDTDRKLRDLLDEFYQLSTENQNLKVKVLSESERAEKAEKIVESLQQSLSKLKSEKEAAFLLYQQCLERVSSLEAEISRGQADISRLNGEILEGTSRLQAAEERFLLSEKENQSLQSEVDILVQKTTVQQRELEKKNEELEKLRICIQDGRIHLMRAEAALQSLKSLHSHLLEEQRILQLELKHGIQMLKDMEFMKQCLENEIWRLKEENLVLNERHKSSTMSINNLQDEIYSLKEVKVKLEEEVGLHVDQGDALRQELYCLREKLHDLDRRHQDVTEQVEAVGLNVNCLQSSVKDLQEENLKLKQSCEDIEYEKAILSSSAKNFQYENLKLKEICETKEHDKEILSEKLENMEKLLVKNELLENSLSDASAELEGLRGKIKMLEESFDLHLREKSTLATEKGFLVSQIESITKNIEKLLEKNSVLENSLSGANVELEGMRAKSTGLEASCQALQDEKSSLLFVIDSMVSQVETIKKCLENLERRHAELENKHSCLEKERESALHNIDKLQLSLNLREQEHETYIQSSQIQLATLGSQIHVLQEEAQSRKIELEEEQGKLINSEVEIFVLQRSIYDIKETSSMLEDTLTDVNVELEGLRLKSKSLEESCQVLQDEKLILLLEIDNLVSQVESIKQCLENMEKRHADLEDRHSCLEKEKESALHNIDELQLSLNLQKEERETYVQSSQAQLATLGSHIHVLQEEAQLRKRQFEEEQDKFMNSDVEIFVLQRYICDMRERNSMLENSLSDVNIEVEGLREKCKSLEESCQFLQDEELSHLLEIENMVCQVESVEQCLENSEERHAELEDKHMHLEKERESALHHIDELQLELSTRKKEQETYLQSSQAQLATLENQIYLLQEEAELRKRQFEEVQDKFMYAEFEIVVLQRCIHDMKESNLLLSIECKEQIEASMHAKKLILELEEENLGQQMKVKSLLENNEKLRTGIHHVLKSLGIVADDGCCDITIREFFPLILGKIKDMQCSVLDTEDEKQQLLFEKIVSDTLLKQLQLDASDLKSDKHALEQESVIRSNELLMLQREKHELLETNKQLKHGVHEGQRRVGILMGDVEILQGKLSDSQEAYQKLQDENYKLREENQSLKKEIYDLKEEQYMVEEENRNLSLIFKSICSEKAMEIETLGNELDHLHGVDNELEQVRIVVKKAEAENLRLKESIAELKKFKTDSMILEDELNMERNVSEQLNREVENGKELLNKKEKELSEAIQKLKGIQNEGAELHKEFSELKFTKEQLDSELQEKTSMVEQSEMEAAAFYEDLQTNAIFLALFKEKAFELVSSCRSLEEYSIIQNEMFSGERDSRNAANKELKIKLGVLERENGALKDELTTYLPLTLSLKDSISSLEELTLTLTKLHANYPETQDAAAVSSHHDVTHQELGEADDAKALAGVTELQKLQTWVQAMEKAMMEMGRLTMQASSNTNARLEAAMKEIEELKSKNSLLQNEVVQNKKGVILQQGDEEEPSKNVEAQNNEAEASRAKRELVMKDIQLDHVSDPLSHENGVDSCRICKKGKSETDDQMLELWETAEQDTRRKRSTKRRTKKPTSTTSFDSVEYRLIKVVEKQKNEYSSSELQSEKELSVDKSEVPERIFVPQDDGNKRILERLASDAQRLTNLQINAQELKRKFEKSEKANQLLGFEYESVKVQLKEVVEAILQLIDVNSKLTKNVEDGSASSGSKGKLEEMGNMRMRQVSERARRWSEQIGRLELEVQRIQFVMVKLENEYGNKGTKAFNRQTGVVLRDYIYGGKGRHRWKKSHCCCACMRPSTKCD